MSASFQDEGMTRTRLDAAPAPRGVCLDRAPAAHASQVLGSGPAWPPRGAAALRRGRRVILQQ